MTGSQSDFARIGIMRALNRLYQRLFWPAQQARQSE